MAKKITLPVTAEAIRELHAGDEVLLSGPLVTARDAAHHVMITKKPEWLRPILKDRMIYHCGPVVRKQPDGKWEFVAAGPTTSIREEPYEADVIRDYQVRGVIGKGGMGKKTLEALKQYGAVYLHAIGGLAQILALRVKEVTNVHMLEELGVPEAFWEIEVEDFPAVVTMDAHGKSLHAEIDAASRKVLEAEIQKMGSEH
ncbi:fumarate hydratase C-terminal domain-containing protein [bacterium]|nr:fumarate hydratase C-terminal domain-containing protein [bacterium]